MAMTDAEFAEQERRAGMIAAGVDVGSVDGPALVVEVKRLRAKNEELSRFMDIFQHEHDVAARRLREANASLAQQLAEAKAELERRSLVTFSAGDAG